MDLQNIVAIVIQKRMVERIVDNMNLFTVYSDYYSVDYLTCQQYQDLMDHGWRRGGRYIYLPDNENNCCPQITVRNCMSTFCATKHQQRVKKQFYDYIKGKNHTVPKNNQTKTTVHIPEIYKESISTLILDSFQNSLSLSSLITVDSSFINLSIKYEKHIPFISSTFLLKILPIIKREYKGDIDLLIHQFEYYLQSKIQDNSIYSFIQSVSIQKNYINIYIKDCFTKDIYLTKDIQNNNNNNIHINPFFINNKPHILTFSLEKPSFKRKLYELYKKYQKEVFHEDDITEESYKENNIETCLIYSSKEDVNYGTYYFIWYLDNVPIAVDILDILPGGISSVYFFYDPIYKPLSLGIVSILKEIELTKQLHLPCHYLGYYVYNCPKMIYKTQFGPCELFCQQTQRWYPLKEALLALHNNKNGPLSLSSSVLEYKNNIHKLYLEKKSHFYWNSDSLHISIPKEYKVNEYIIFPILYIFFKDEKNLQNICTKTIHGLLFFDNIFFDF
ncbi:hypothetical protein WA158_005962 [Blastocystis sp. Blastoise]